jgi:cell division protein ZapA (FtsZ GTPase activity inhibitor)
MEKPPEDGLDSDSNNNEKPSRNKIAQLIEEYNLSAIGQEIEDRWTATGDSHDSLRELTDYFNKRILEQHLLNAGQQTLQGEVETLYALLTDEDVSEGERIRARRRLEQQGIDLDTLTSRFVSYQTLRRYLKDYRNASYTRQESDRIEKELSNIQQLRGRTESVIYNNLQSLQSADHITLEEFRVTTDVHVYCEGCSTQYSATELLEQGGCGCNANE